MSLTRVVELIFVLRFSEDQDANEEDLHGRPRGGQVGARLEDGLDQVVGHGQEALRGNRETGPRSPSRVDDGGKSAVLRIVGYIRVKDKHSLFGMMMIKYFLIDTPASSILVCSVWPPAHSNRKWPYIWQ